MLMDSFGFVESDNIHQSTLLRISDVMDVLFLIPVLREVIEKNLVICFLFFEVGTSHCPSSSNLRVLVNWLHLWANWR